jgi:hypothetical protein
MDVDTVCFYVPSIFRSIGIGGHPRAARHVCFVPCENGRWIVRRVDLIEPACDQRLIDDVGVIGDDRGRPVGVRVRGTAAGEVASLLASDEEREPEEQPAARLAPMSRAQSNAAGLPIDFICQLSL